ncbi:glycine-rich protein 23 [Cannabis sativa]|uniref:glycine-rich protein 23 n=1 Tax=Cannabis sativa TaxID=3483 RepID=UPI0029C9DDAC|nr:glycine-rich protein 23 [Cannabis sativa]
MMMKWLPIVVIVLLFVSPRATSRDIPNTPLDQTVLHANAPVKAESPSDSNGLGDKKNFIYGGVGGFAGMGGYAGVNGVLPTLGGSGSFNKFGGIGGAGGIGGVAGIGGLPGTTGGLPGGLGGGFPTMGGVADAPPGGGILHP